MNLLNNCLEEFVYRDVTLKKRLENSKVDISKLTLTELELKLIYIYTGIDYDWINSDLKIYGKNHNKCKEAVKKIINSGLSKINPYNNKTVYRKETFNNLVDTKKVFKENKGNVIKRNAFFSTSKEKKNWNNTLIIKIQTNNESNARDLKEVNINSPEREVLFKTNTHFKIINTTNNLVELKEIKKAEEKIIKWKDLHSY